MKYDTGGNLLKLEGAKNGTYTYTSDMEYDEWGHLTKCTKGNGVVTNYVYDDTSTWLDSIEASSTPEGNF